MVVLRTHGFRDCLFPSNSCGTRDFSGRGCSPCLCDRIFQVLADVLIICVLTASVHFLILLASVSYIVLVVLVFFHVLVGAVIGALLVVLVDSVNCLMTVDVIANLLALLILVAH